MTRGQSKRQWRLDRPPRLGSWRRPRSPPFAATTVNGDLGVCPGNTVTGAPIVNGTTHLGDPTAAQAQADLTIAYNDAAGRTLDAVLVAGNLGGQTLAPGLYKSTTSLEISSGDLTLDAVGRPECGLDLPDGIHTRHDCRSPGDPEWRGPGGERLLAGRQFSDDWREFCLQGKHHGCSRPSR